MVTFAATQSRIASNFLVAGVLSFCSLPVGGVADESPTVEPPPIATPPTSGAVTHSSDLITRLEQLERQNAEFAEQHALLTNQLDALTNQFDVLNQQSCSGCQYDHERGAVLLVPGWEEHPFELRADFFTQTRYTNFGRNTESFMESTGLRMPVRNFDSIEINRNFINFSGYALDPRLQFTAMVFSSTSLDDTLYLGWINYRFSEALDVRVGNWQLPGTREWYESFRFTLGTERLMATTFFRPNVSPGIWIQGVFFENLRYVAMLANSTNRLGRSADQLGTARAFSGTVWWEPTGDFGRGPSDIECHAAPSLRLGASTTLAKESNQGFGNPEAGNPEDTILRLTDGTPLFRFGALAPGVQLLSTRFNLWAIDAAVKYRGMSVAGEYFFRRLHDFQARPGQVPYKSLYDHGGLLQAGAFVLRNEVEVFARGSFVTGLFGSGHEVGGGVNWYPLGSREWRFTAEALHIDDSPAQNILTGYRAGESGTLFKLQWFADF